MSFGYSVRDALLLAQLVLHTLKATRDASNEYGGLTRQVSTLNTLLNRVENEVLNMQHPSSQEKASRQKELHEHVTGCRHLLASLYLIMNKHSALGNDFGADNNKDWKKRLPKLWKLWNKVAFGHSKAKVLADIRGKLPTYMTAIKITLLIGLRESTSEVEAHLRSQSSQTEGLVGTVNLILGKLSSGEEDFRKSFEKHTELMLKKICCELRKDYPLSDFTDSISSLRAYVEEVAKSGVLEDRYNDGHASSRNDLTQSEPEVIEPPEIDQSKINPPQSETPNVELSEAEPFKAKSPKNDLEGKDQEDGNPETSNRLARSSTFERQDTTVTDGAHILDPDRLSEQLLPGSLEGVSDKGEIGSTSSCLEDDKTETVESFGSNRRCLFLDHVGRWDGSIWRVSGFTPVSYSCHWMNTKEVLKSRISEKMGDDRLFLQKYDDCRKLTGKILVIFSEDPRSRFEVRTILLYGVHTRIRVKRLQVCTSCPYYPCNSKASKNSYPPWVPNVPQWNWAHFWNPKFKKLYVNGIVLDGISFSTWVILWTGVIWGSQSVEMLLVEDFMMAVIVVAKTIELLSSERRVRVFLTRNRDIAPVLKEALRAGNRLWEDLQKLLDSAQEYAFDERRRCWRYRAEGKKSTGGEWFSKNSEKPEVTDPQNDLIEEVILRGLGIRGTPEWEDTQLFITNTHTWYKTVRYNFKGLLG